MKHFYLITGLQWIWTWLCFLTAGIIIYLLSPGQQIISQQKTLTVHCMCFPHFPLEVSAYISMLPYKVKHLHLSSYINSYERKNLSLSYYHRCSSISCVWGQASAERLCPLRHFWICHWMSIPISISKHAAHTAAKMYATISKLVRSVFIL